MFVIRFEKLFPGIIDSCRSFNLQFYRTSLHFHLIKIDEEVTEIYEIIIQYHVIFLLTYFL